MQQRSDNPQPLMSDSGEKTTQEKRRPTMDELRARLNKNAYCGMCGTYMEPYGMVGRSYQAPGVCCECVP